MSSSQESNIDQGENAFRILIATDNHIGYLESDPVRGQDSFKTFKEILQIAQDKEVDFILLGGDLFHHNRPSRSCLYKTMKMLREYCFGERESKVWIASDQSVNFGDEFSKANYLDENINISMPVFSIHGNHDDPSGVGNLCALNLLSVSGMVNYFGASSSIEDVTIYPILMQKGQSKLALYGLGNIREERLHRQWRSGRVKFMRPEANNEDNEDGWKHCFNMFVFHQNRARHGPTSHIPEEFLDGFLDLVFWGHEHECRIHPEEYQNFSITQPGSSVATSLTLGEAEPKHVGILTIEGGQFSIEKIKLKSIRPLQFTSVVLSQVDDIIPSNVKSIQTYLEGVVEQLIERAKLDWESENPNVDMPIPLVRIRVDYSGGYETFNTQQFGQKFIKRVANPKDMLKFQKAINSSITRQARRATEVLNDLSTSIPERLDKLKVEDLVSELLQKDLFILPETQLEEAVMTLVEKSDKNAISQFVKKSVSQTRESITVLPEDIQDLTLDYIKRKSTESKQSQDNRYNEDQGGRSSIMSSLSQSQSTTSNNNSNHSNSRRTTTTTITTTHTDAVSPIPSLQGNTMNNDNNNNDDEVFHISSSSEEEDDDDSPSPPPKQTARRGGRGGNTTTRGRGRGKRIISPKLSPSPPPSNEPEGSNKRRRVLPSFSATKRK